MTCFCNGIPIITTLYPNSRVVDLGQNPRCRETSSTLGVTEPHFGASVKVFSDKVKREVVFRAVSLDTLVTLDIYNLLFYIM